MWENRLVVDLVNKSIDLDPGSTKNKGARVVRMTNRVFELVAACVEGRSPDDLVFKRDGKPILDFRKSWRNACEATGVPNLHIHDLRRTVPGISGDSVCMKQPSCVSEVGKQEAF